MAPVENQGAGVEPVEVATCTAGAPAFLSLLRGSLVVFRARDIDWDGETLTHEGQRYRLGDSVDLGGGLMTLRRLTGLRLPAGWADSVEAFVVAPSGP